jgi:hypothetical protein
MADWPSVGTPNAIREGSYRPQIRTDKEANYIQVRPGSTRTRKRWVLSWVAMSEVNYSTLKTFFDSYQGSSFNWTHPITSTVYVAVFVESIIAASWVAPGYWAIDIEIEEL